MNEASEWVRNNLTPEYMGLMAFIVLVAIGLGIFLFKRAQARKRREIIPPAGPKAAPPSPTLPSEVAPEIPGPLAAPTAAPVAAPKAEAKKDFRSLLARTQEAFTIKLENLILSTKQIDESFVDSLEELLYTSDLGPRTVEKLLGAVRAKLSRGELHDLTSIKQALFTEILEILHTAEKQDSFGSKLNWTSAPVPWVVLVVGVNGVGKTTSIGKLAHFFASQGRRVVVVAGDTFRAAATEQLSTWGERADVDVYTSTKTTEPAAVAFEGVQKAINEKYDVAIVDTAGRLHTKENLMEELKKVKRVMGKALPGAPHETILVIDANSGQNALVQARQFHQAVGVTSLIVTKLDGTARGGMIVGIAEELGIGVQFVGVGEKLGDLQTFSADEYAKALLSL